MSDECLVIENGVVFVGAITGVLYEYWPTIVVYFVSNGEAAVYELVGDAQFLFVFRVDVWQSFDVVAVSDWWRTIVFSRFVLAIYESAYTESAAWWSCDHC